MPPSYPILGDLFYVSCRRYPWHTSPVAVAGRCETILSFFGEMVASSVISGALVNCLVILPAEVGDIDIVRIVTGPQVILPPGLRSGSAGHVAPPLVGVAYRILLIARHKESTRGAAF